MLRTRYLIETFFGGVFIGLLILTIVIIGMVTTSSNDGPDQRSKTYSSDPLNPPDNTLFMRPHVNRIDPTLVTFSFIRRVPPERQFARFFIDTGDNATMINTTATEVTYRYSRVFDYFALYWAQYENGSITHPKECYFDLRTVNSSPPVLRSYPSLIVMKYNDQPALFYFGSSYDLDGTIVLCEMDFGDGILVRNEYGFNTSDQ